MRRAEDRAPEQRREPEAELDAEQALARPVDVAQIEQQRGLVEGEPDAGAEGQRERRSRADGLGDAGPALPTRRRSGCPGTKWWMWRPPSRTLPAGHHPLRIPAVDTRIERERADTKPERRLKSTVSRPATLPRSPPRATATASCGRAASPSSSACFGTLVQDRPASRRRWTRRRARRIPSPSTEPAVASAGAAEAEREPVGDGGRRDGRTIRASRRAHARPLEPRRGWERPMPRVTPRKSSTSCASGTTRS